MEASKKNTAVLQEAEKLKTKPKTYTEALDTDLRLNARADSPQALQGDLGAQKDLKHSQKEQQPG